MNTNKKNNDGDIFGHVTITVNASENRIIQAFRELYLAPTNAKRPHGKRGPNDTRMMRIQRTTVINYIEVVCHRHPSEVTDEDVFRCWNAPENKAAWDAAAKRADGGRGYKSPHSLCLAIRNLYKR